MSTILNKNFKILQNRIKELEREKVPCSRDIVQEILDLGRTFPDSRRSTSITEIRERLKLKEEDMSGRDILSIAKEWYRFDYASACDDRIFLK